MHSFSETHTLIAKHLYMLSATERPGVVCMERFTSLAHASCPHHQVAHHPCDPERPPHWQDRADYEVPEDGQF